jgi:hypothetical protein
VQPECRIVFFLREGGVGPLSEQVIHDDTHARAVLLGIMRAARSDYMERYRKLEREHVPKRYNFKEYKENCRNQKALYGDTLIYESSEKHHRTKREWTYLVFFGGVNYYDENYSDIKKEKLYPADLEVLDSKVTSTTGRLRTVFYLSEHAIIKMIRRSRCNTMADLSVLLNRYIEPFIRVTIQLEVTDDFVAVCGDSYIPCTLSEDGIIVVKTWISRSSWNDQTEAKLLHTCEYLKNENRIALIPTTIFAEKKYWGIEEVKKYVICESGVVR